LPEYPDIEKSSWRIGRIPISAASGFLQRDDVVEDEQEIPCAPGVKRLRLEPGTDTGFNTHRVVVGGYLYKITFTLPSKDRTDADGKPWRWIKWRWVYIPEPMNAHVKDDNPIGAPDSHPERCVPSSPVVG
jgi:hypothetical protein